MQVGCVLRVKRQEGGLSSEHISITLSITAPQIRYFPSSSGTGRIGPVATAAPERLPALITPQAEDSENVPHLRNMITRQP